MSKQRLSVLNDDGVLLCGYYKKLKTMKKKYFVLYNETPCKVARIEYYDNEKKYKSGFTPKRIIKIKNCFNINRRFYTKHDFVIVLASKEGGFGIVMESEDDMNTWLNHLLHLQRSGETSFDFPKFDYVWQVVIQKKGIAEQHNIFGSYHICLTNKSVTFIKIGREKNVGDKKITKIEVLLTTIRRCGDSQCYFYMEIGRQSSLGPGELWMETEDSLTAQNMHRMILSKMISLNEALVEPMRKRSSSATETTNLHHDRKSSQNLDITNNYLLNAQNFSRDRCDSLPSRNRTSSECSNHSIRIKPITSANRVMNFHISNTSPVVYSASEESVSVDDSEDSIGMPYLLSSRSPEGVILEEYIDDALHSQKINEYSDMNSVLTLSSVPGSKANINPIKKCGPAKVTDIKKDICGNIDDQLQYSVRAYSFGGKDESDLAKESMVNRVRAFSVGSRNKSTRICSKTSFKFNSDNINNDFVESSTRKSISVPVLINRHLQATDRMGDLMEIDFSKSIDKTLKKNIQHNKIECQNASNVLPRSLNISNSIESIDRSIKSVDNGYLEMKPITLASNSSIYNGNNLVNNTVVHSQNRHNFEQKDISIDSTALTDTRDDITLASTQKVSNYHNIPDKGIQPADDDGKIKECTSSIPINNLTLSSECSNNYSEKNTSDVIKLPQVDISSTKQQDLYYASLDLPKCGNEVNTRYSFKESLSDTNIGEIKNEYAKINFDKPETSCSLREEKTLSFQ